jgi:hypothetical protein
MITKAGAIRLALCPRAWTPAVLLSESRFRMPGLQIHCQGVLIPSSRGSAATEEEFPIPDGKFPIAETSSFGIWNLESGIPEPKAARRAQRPDGGRLYPEGWASSPGYL